MGNPILLCITFVCIVFSLPFNHCPITSWNMIHDYLFIHIVKCSLLWNRIHLHILLTIKRFPTKQTKDTDAINFRDRSLICKVLFPYYMVYLTGEHAFSKLIILRSVCEDMAFFHIRTNYKMHYYGICNSIWTFRDSKMHTKDHTICVMKVFLVGN